MFKETIVSQKLGEKKKKVKGTGAAWEEAQTSSDEEVVEEKKEEEKTMEDLIMEEYKALMIKEGKEREFLRKEMKPDMYIEKILSISSIAIRRSPLNLLDGKSNAQRTQLLIRNAK